MSRSPDAKTLNRKSSALAWLRQRDALLDRDLDAAAGFRQRLQVFWLIHIHRVDQALQQG